MKKYIILSLLLLVFVVKGSAQIKAANERQMYTCAPCNGSCDTMTFYKDGKCPHCGMALVKKIASAQSAGATKKELNVCFYLQNNVEVLDFAGPLEVFTAAGFNVFIVSKTKEKILSEGTLTIIPDYSIADAPVADVMVFFGGAHSKPANDTALISWIRSRKKQTTYFMSICTGAFIIGKAGILDNLTATTYHSQIAELQKALPKTKVLSNVRFVDNGYVISTAGISAGIDGALHLVAKIKGKDFAQQVATDIEYDKWVPRDGLVIEQK
jgi:transcriptional regulator GlxA family with amidase domain/DNA-directed RNA polymerase subunit RPC12/RpoP